jgi:hypothetical protein
MPITDAICYLFQAHAQHFLYMLKQFLLSAALIKLKPPGPAHLRFLLRTMPCETTAGGCTGSRWSQARANDNGHMDTWWPQKEATKIVTGVGFEVSGLSYEGFGLPYEVFAQNLEAQPRWKP